ncbi:DUF2175 domain-containing protein [Humibacter sp. RRB41]|uniref:DUF2175 domain-containing protein n=1 Tax=Humibacter sp. RRB41 TaxID=2919946 RepID=UPI001FAA8F8B|nr:DUF2175 domain-containing protein [Humibacter sp. RRB41]
MSAFQARYGGKCGGCGAEVMPGQLVVFVDDEVVHLECEPWALRNAEAADVCQVCWLVKPCACEEDQ